MSQDEPPVAAASILRRCLAPNNSFALAELGPLSLEWKRLVEKLIAAGLIKKVGRPGNQFRTISNAAHQATQSLATYAEQLPASFFRHLAELPDRADWTIADLFDLETRRVTAAQAAGIEPRPLRQQQSALIIVKARRSTGDVYLLTQRLGWKGYGLIGGKFDPRLDQSLADTARRELIEELHLLSGEFRVQPLPISPVVVTAISRRVGVLTKYKFELFQLLSQEPLKTGKGFVWFRREEVKRGVSKAGESLNHLAYPEIHRALWQDLPGGLDSLPISWASSEN